MKKEIVIDAKNIRSFVEAFENVIKYMIEELEQYVTNEHEDSNEWNDGSIMMIQTAKLLLPAMIQMLSAVVEGVENAKTEAE